LLQPSALHASVLRPTPMLISLHGSLVQQVVAPADVSAVWILTAMMIRTRRLESRQLVRQ